MKLGLVIVAAGCNAVTNGTGSAPPPPPPVVASLTPTSGPFGTSITIDGSGFGSAQRFVDFDDTPSALPGTGSELYVDHWSDTEVVGRVGFPCSGAMTMRTEGGTASVGTFATDMPWLPGPGLGVSTLLTSRVLSTGAIAAVYAQLDDTEGAALAIFGGGSATSYELDNIIDQAEQDPDMNVQIVEADDHTPEVIATQHDGTVVAITIANGVLVVTPTGITGQVWAAGRDATGVFAWIDSGGLVRARPGTPWTTDRGPFQPAFQPLDGAVAADGTLWISMNKPNLDDPFDIEGYVALQSLGPTDTQFSPIELADPDSYDDVISQAHIVLADDGVHMVVVAFARDNGTGQESYVPVDQRTAPGTWSAVAMPPGGVVPTFQQYGFTGTTLGVAIADPSTLIATLIPDVTMSISQTLPIWPATPEGLVEIAGQLQPIVTTGGAAYVPTQP